MEENEDVNELLLNKAPDNSDNEKIEESIRASFIAKVYSILLFQLIITSFFVILSLYSPLYREILQNSVFLYYFFLIIPFVCLIIMLCNPNLLRKVPLNYFILIVFTIGISYIVSYITSFYTPGSVLFSLILTFVMVITLILYAKYTKRDFTIYGGVLFVFLTCIIFGSFFLLFFNISVFEFIITICTIICFSGYIIYDTQLILGKRSKEFSIDDYILAALNLYLDIVNLFIEILSLFGERN